MICVVVNSLAKRNSSTICTSMCTQQQSKHVCKNSFACFSCYKFSVQSNLSASKNKNMQKILLRCCTVCDLSFSSSRSLRRHLYTHKGERPYACDLCTKSYTELDRLSEHKKKIHQGIRTHFCKVCGRGFFLKSEYKLHLRTHTGENPFACDQCEKSFARADGLTKHIHMNAIYVVADSLVKQNSSTIYISMFASISAKCVIEIIVLKLIFNVIYAHIPVTGHFGVINAIYHFEKKSFW